LRGLVARSDRVIGDISGDEQVLDAVRAGLPPGAALAEAMAVRLRRHGAELVWGEPRVIRDRRAVLERCGARGRSSVEIVRADPSLLTELQLGSWFDAVWRTRLLRRLGGTVAVQPWAELRLAADAAFWRGVRSIATSAEWMSWTKSSYTALVYHRLAGERKPGQERIDLAPHVFARQLRMLHRLGFRHVELDDILALHDGGPKPALRRAFVVTIDDGVLDCLPPLLKRAEKGIQLFVSTAEVGGRAHWLANEPLLSWDDVRTLADAGVVIGSHAQHHRPLVGRDAAQLAGELEDSRSSIGRELGSLPAVVAYPHGAHDEQVRAATAAAGYRAAFTTEKGRNGCGTDRYCLRRVSVHEADGVLAILWKVMTGEGLPRVWLRARSLRQAIRKGSRRD
jgi:peptidoglycan/xylan/chitin deacetylase (PgdA/CDA1 family)